ncbi:hypothetical protein WA158_001343 [Blastocystis sp. Blastoise]
MLIAVPATLAICLVFEDKVGGFAIINGRSMQPTLNPSKDDDSYSKDIILTNKINVRRAKFTRGSIVVLKSPLDPKRLLIKRLVAIDGDLIRTEENSLIEIPQGNCWVEGDNGSNSIDSHRFGAIPLALIVAEATYIIWPFTRISKLVKQPSRSKVVYKEESKFCKNND